MQLTLKELIGVMGLVEGMIEYELEDSEENFCEWDTVILKLNAQLREKMISMGLEDKTIVESE